MAGTRQVDFETAARAALSEGKAAEILRQYQQGFGRPIISTEFQGHRVVAVGKTIKWSPAWRYFSDFLLDHLKDVIGRPWAIQAQREGKDHPIFVWLSTMNQVAQSSVGSSPYGYRSSGKGHFGAIWRLGYALYLIAHNDQLDAKIIARLRSPISFRATYHETQIAAAFAVTGFKISMAELRRTSGKTPEFWATSLSGRRFSVEAKCKDAWKSHLDPHGQQFKAELRQWIRDQLYKCSLKALPNAVYCLELSLPVDWPPEIWASLADEIRGFIREAENIRVKGAEPKEAYVIVTNNVDVLEHQEFAVNRVAMLTAFNMSDWYENGESVELEAAFDSHEKHREMHKIFKTFEEIDEIPQSFDGLASVFDESGQPLEIELRIGRLIDYPDEKGRVQRGLIYDVTSVGDVAWVCVENRGKHHIVKVPLAAHEMQACLRYGDAVFGKPEKKKENLEGDPMKFYDWITDVYAGYDRKALLIQIQNHDRLREFGELSTDELRTRAAREVTKAVLAQTDRQTGRSRGGGEA